MHVTHFVWKFKKGSLRCLVKSELNFDLFIFLTNFKQYLSSTANECCPAKDGYITACYFIDHNLHWVLLTFQPSILLFNFLQAFLVTSYCWFFLYLGQWTKWNPKRSTMEARPLWHSHVRLPFLLILDQVARHPVLDQRLLTATVTDSHVPLVLQHSPVILLTSVIHFEWPAWTGVVLLILISVHTVPIHLVLTASSSGPCT